MIKFMIDNYHFIMPILFMNIVIAFLGRISFFDISRLDRIPFIPKRVWDIFRNFMPHI